MTTTLHVKLGYLHPDKVVKVVTLGKGPTERVAAILRATDETITISVWDGQEVVFAEDDAKYHEDVTTADLTA